MNKGVSVVVYPVQDIASARTLFTRLLGTAPDYDDPSYVGWLVDEQHIGLDPNGASRGMTGATPFFEVEDIRATLASLLEAGGELVEDVWDVGGGGLIAMVKDIEGNMIGLSQSL